MVGEHIYCQEKCLVEKIAHICGNYTAESYIAETYTAEKIYCRKLYCRKNILLKIILLKNILLKMILPKVILLKNYTAEKIVLLKIKLLDKIIRLKIILLKIIYCQKSYTAQSYTYEKDYTAEEQKNICWKKLYCSTSTHWQKPHNGWFRSKVLPIFLLQKLTLSSRHPVLLEFPALLQIFIM